MLISLVLSEVSPYEVSVQNVSCIQCMFAQFHVQFETAVCLVLLPLISPCSLTDELLTLLK